MSDTEENIFNDEWLTQLANQSDEPETVRNKEPEAPEREPSEPLPWDDDLPDLTDENLEIHHYDIHGAGVTGDPGRFATAFLGAVAEDYEEQGWGIYTSILRFPHNRVDDELVKRFQSALSSSISRARQAAPPERRNFSLINLQYAILDDNQHVLFTIARARSEWADLWAANKIVERTAPSISQSLAGLL